MSSSKLKKSIEDLRTYLGRDEVGVNLLENVKRHASSIRKDLSSTREKSIKIESTLEKVTKENRNQSLEINRLKEELAKERSKLRQQEQNSKRLEARVSEQKAKLDQIFNDEEILGAEDNDKLYNVKKIMSVLAGVRRKVPLLAEADRVIKLESATDSIFFERDKYMVYDISKIIKDLSHDQLHLLGSIVAVLTLFNFPCVFESKRYATLGGSSDKNHLPFSETQLEKFIQWFRKNVSSDMTAFGIVIDPGGDGYLSRQGVIRGDYVDPHTRQNK